MNETTPQPSEWKIITPEGVVSAIPTKRIIEGSKKIRGIREEADSKLLHLPTSFEPTEVTDSTEPLQFPTTLSETTDPTVVTAENTSKKLSAKAKGYLALGAAVLASIGLVFSIKDTVQNRNDKKTMYITDSMAEGLRENLSQPGHYLEVVLGTYRMDADVPLRATPMLIGNPYNKFENLSSFGNQLTVNTPQAQSQLITNFPLIRSGQEVAHSFNWGIKKVTVNEEGKTDLGFFPVNNETGTKIVKITPNGEESIDSNNLETVDCETAYNPKDIGDFGELQIGCETKSGEIIPLYKNPSR
ncbi:MAG: hypothetical protein ABIO02_03555 [Patescibacteria group bacterium]